MYKGLSLKLEIESFKIGFLNYGNKTRFLYIANW